MPPEDTHELPFQYWPDAQLLPEVEVTHAVPLQYWPEEQLDAVPVLPLVERATHEPPCHWHADITLQLDSLVYILHPPPMPVLPLLHPYSQLEGAPSESPVTLTDAPLGSPL